jgi:hypothetical protein
MHFFFGIFGCLGLKTHLSHAIPASNQFSGSTHKTLDTPALLWQSTGNTAWSKKAGPLLVARKDRRRKEEGARNPAACSASGIDRIPGKRSVLLFHFCVVSHFYFLGGSAR